MKMILCLVEVRELFDAMKFYGKTEFYIIYVTTHNAVIAARNALNLGMNLILRKNSTEIDNEENVKNTS